MIDGLCSLRSSELDKLVGSLANQQQVRAAWDDAADWEQELVAAGVPARLHPDRFDPQGKCSVSDVSFAVVWKPPATLLKQCPNLRGVHSLGAGVDSILNTGAMPGGVPLARIVRSTTANNSSASIAICVSRWPSTHAISTNARVHAPQQTHQHEVTAYRSTLSWQNAWRPGSYGL